MKKRKPSGDKLTIDQRRALLQVKIRHDVEEHGCFIMCVFGSESTPPWAYSIGIPTTIEGAAEIIVFGLGYEQAGQIINLAVELMREGRRIESGCYFDGIFQGVPVYFGKVEERHYDAHVGQAQIYHHSDHGFPLFQLVWPDDQGRFPWQDGFDESCRSFQPMLFEVPVE